MYKLIIIDDEERIRRGMCNSINWGDLGFNLAADFEDGKEAIEYLKCNQVDVVLTDIKMAEVSGLEVAKYVFENAESTKVVIMSGYREFDYAKKAIEYNVLQYLLKPVDIEETCKTFAGIKGKLDAESSVRIRNERDSHEAGERLPVLKKQFLYNVFMGIIKSSDVLEMAEMSGFDSDTLSKRCCIVVDLCDKYETVINRNNP